MIKRKFNKQIISQQHTTGAIILIVMMVTATFSVGMMTQYDMFAKADEYEPQDVGSWDYNCSWPDAGNYSGNDIRISVQFFHYDGHNPYVYFCGGYDTGGGTYISDIIRINTDSNVSQLLTNFAGDTGPGGNPGVCFDAANEEFYTAGGWAVGGNPGASKNGISKYALHNITDGGWDTGANLPANMYGLGKGVFYDGICYWAPGCATNEVGINKVIAYNPSNNSAWYVANLAGANNVTSSEPGGFVYSGIGDELVWFAGAAPSDAMTSRIIKINVTNGTAWHAGDRFRGIASNSYAVYNDVNDTIIEGPWRGRHLGGGVFVNGFDIIEYDPATLEPANFKFIGNYTYSSTPIHWDNRTENKSIIFSNSWYYQGGWSVHGGMSKLDLGLGQEPPTPSAFNIYGLEGSDANITWSGTITESIWSNATQPGGTLELNMSINTTDNLTEIRVYCDDIDASILASNNTLYVSSDNSSFGSLGAFTDGGSNISINTSTWNDGTMGTNPFDGEGLTNKTVSIYMRFLLVLGNTAGEFSQSDWKIYLGYYG